MRRGDFVTVALQGDMGKPRPALVIQSDLFADHPSLTLLPVTSDLRDAPLLRLAVAPLPANGLRVPSQIMIDKPQSVGRDKIGATIGHLDAAGMVAVNRAITVFLGLG